MYFQASSHNRLRMLSVDANGYIKAHKPLFERIFMCFMSEETKSQLVDWRLKTEIDAVSALRDEEMKVVQYFLSEDDVTDGNCPSGKFFYQNRTNAEAVIGIRLIEIFICDILGRQSLAAAVYKHSFRETFEYVPLTIS